MIDIQDAILLADDQFQVITAVVKTFYTCLSLGVKGATTVEASVFIDEIEEIYSLFTSGDKLGAYEKQNNLNQNILKYPSPAAKDNFLRVAELKYLLSLRGICQEWVTPYYRQLEVGERNALKEFYLNLTS